jgi:tRNA threonylcarbamoyladenosine biosynthesis protein TsaE
MISHSIDKTIEIGAKLGKKLRAGDVVALIGDLGAGKTVLTKGIARGLGVRNVKYVNSPTFVIIKEYKGRVPLYHFDLYRLNKSNVLDAENFEEYFYGTGVTVVEWADKIPKLLPKKYIEVKLSVTGESRRNIRITKILNSKSKT